MVTTEAAAAGSCSSVRALALPPSATAACLSLGLAACQAIEMPGHSVAVKSFPLQGGHRIDLAATTQQLLVGGDAKTVQFQSHTAARDFRQQVIGWKAGLGRLHTATVDTQSEVGICQASCKYKDDSWTLPIWIVKWC